MLLLLRQHRHGRAAEHGDHLAVADPVRRGDDYLVAGVNERREGDVDVVLCAARYDYLGVVVIHAAVGLEAGGRGLAQLNDAGGGGVFCLALADGVYGGVLDVHGRLKIGLARAEADDIQSVGAHLLRHGVYGQGG